MTNTVETLKILTQTTYDSVEGYRSAAEKSESTALTRALEQRADKRRQTLTKLNTALTNHGEKPISSVSMSGSAHQMFLKVTEAFSNGDKAAIERVDEGEEYIAGQFREALSADDIQSMDMAVRTVLQDAYTEISKGEKFAETLEDQFA